MPISDAEVYAEWVKEKHRHPFFKSEAHIFDWFNVEWVSMDRMFGAWTMTMVTFKDGSQFNVIGNNVGVDEILWEGNIWDEAAMKQDSQPS